VKILYCSRTEDCPHEHLKRWPRKLFAASTGQRRRSVAREVDDMSSSSTTDVGVGGQWVARDGKYQRRITWTPQHGGV